MKARRIASVIASLGICVVIISLTACTPASPTSVSSAGHAGTQRTVSPGARKIGDVPEKRGWFDLHFINETEGWLADAKHLWRTADGGRSWEIVHTADDRKSTQRIRKVEFRNSRAGWVLGHDGLYKTEDQGHALTRLPTPLDYPKGELNSFTFLEDGKVGWAVGGIYRKISSEELRQGKHPNNAVTTFPDDSHAVLEAAVFGTNDGGNRWYRESIPGGNYRIYDVYFSNAKHGLAIGDGGALFTRDGGKAWKVAVFRKECVDPKFLELYDHRPVAASFVQPDLGWLSFDDGRLAKSTDGGQTWCDLLRPESGWPEGEQNAYFQNIHFINPTRGWGLKANGKLYETNDGGSTWVGVSETRFDDMYFLDGRLGWAVGEEGLFLINP